MIKVSKQINKEKFLRKSFKNLKRQKCKHLSYLFALLLLTLSCSSYKAGEKKIKWNYPPDNPYPTVMKLLDIDGYVPTLSVALKPNSVKFSCTLRNDSPYYWCGIEGTIQNSDPKLPKIVGATFHSVVDKNGKRFAKELVKRLVKAKKTIYLVAPTGFYIDKEENRFGNLMFGVYNEHECMDIFYDFLFCPKGAKKFDIHDNKYIETQE